MKRDHLMGYTGHLDALFGKQEQKSARTPPRPPQSQALIDERRLADKIATKRLDVQLAGIVFHGQEQSRLNRGCKNIEDMAGVATHMNSGRELLPYQKSILEKIEEAAERNGKSAMQKTLSTAYGGGPTALHNIPKDPTEWPFPDLNVLDSSMHVAATKPKLSAKKIPNAAKPSKTSERSRLKEECTRLMEELKAAYVKDNDHPMFLRDVDDILREVVKSYKWLPGAHPISVFSQVFERATVAELRDLEASLIDWYEDCFGVD